MVISESIEYFLINQKLKGNTDCTIDGYRSFLNNFQKFLGSDLDINSINVLHINRYHLHLRDKFKDNNPKKKLKLRSVQTYLRHLKVFFTFLHTEGVVKDDLALKIILPKAEKPTIEILTDEEIDLLLSSFNVSTELGARNRAICFLMLDCGLRVGDICNLKLSDINYSNGYINVEMGKGRKSRIVPIGFKCRKAVTDYLYKQRLALDVQSDYIFLSKSREPLNVELVVSIFTKLRKRVGIKRLHAHLLRHTFATNFLINEMGDIYQLSQILGHEEVKTTQMYLHVANYYKIIKKNRNSTYLDRML